MMSRYKHRQPPRRLTGCSAFARVSRMTFAGVFWGAFCGAFGAASALAQQTAFQPITLSLSAPVFENAFAMKFAPQGGRSLVVHVRGDDQRHAFEIFDARDLESGATQGARLIKVPENAVFFSVGEQPDGLPDALVILTEKGVERYDPASGTFVPLIATSSIFRQGIDLRFVRSSFARDLNDDGRFDLIVPDFDGARVFIQGTDGGFSDPVTLPVEPEMRLVGRFSNDNISDTELAPPAPTTPSFSVFPYYLFEATGDDRKDIVYNVGTDFLIFEQTADGSFSTRPQTVSLAFDVRGNRWVDQLVADERNADQSQFRDTTVYRILDLDGDDIAEVITVENKANGVFDREQTFSVYNGRIAEGRLTYGREPDFVYALEGVGGVGFRDLDKDDRLDLTVTAFKLSIPKIISVLVTRKLKVNTLFYRNEQATGLAAQKSGERSTLIEVDLSRGLTNNPVLVYDDFDGDAVLDLLTSDKGELIILKNSAGDLFSDEIASMKTTLPADGSLVHTVDLNDDVRKDVIVRYNRLGLDGEENRKTLTVFLSR